MSGTTRRIGRMAGRLTLVALVVTTVLAGASHRARADRRPP